MPSVHEAQPHLQMLETLLDAWEKLEVPCPSTPTGGHGGPLITLRRD